MDSEIFEGGLHEIEIADSMVVSTGSSGLDGTRDFVIILLEAKSGNKIGFKSDPEQARKLAASLMNKADLVEADKS